MPTTLKKPTLPQLAKRVQSVFNHWIRLRDQGQPCISCGKEWEETFQAGHFLPETHQMTRFHPVNVNSQCIRCNRWLHGNNFGYAKGLAERIGAKPVWQLMQTWGQTYSYTREQLEQLMAFYKAKVKEMESAGVWLQESPRRGSPQAI